MVAVVKCWPVTFKKREENGALPEFGVGIFQCPECKTMFRSKVEFRAQSAETANIKNGVEKIRDIRAGFMQTLRTLREKIRPLETEQASLTVEIVKLKKFAESRAGALKKEVNQLHEEVKYLRELLGSSEEVHLTIPNLEFEWRT
jgi:vacuolar-type H+-ATPase subunit I/STV1